MSVVGRVDARIQVSQLFAQLAYRGLTSNKLSATA